MSRAVGYAYFFVAIAPLMVIVSISQDTYVWLIIYMPFLLLSVFLVYKHMVALRLKTQMTSTTQFFEKMLNLELDDLNQQFQDVLVYTDSRGRSFRKTISMDDKDSIEMLHWMLRLIEKGNSDVETLMNDFLEYRPTDPRYYKYSGIVLYGYLLNDRIEDFVGIYKTFKETLMSRTEYRVMGRLPGEFRLFDKWIGLDFSFLDLMYLIYGEGKDLETDILSYKTRDAYHRNLYLIILDQYFKSIENRSLLSDYEEEYNQAVLLRSTYKMTPFWKEVE